MIGFGFRALVMQEAARRMVREIDREMLKVQAEGRAVIRAHNAGERRMRFNVALAALMDGARIQRSGWSGVKLADAESARRAGVKPFLFLVPASEFMLDRAPVTRAHYGKGAVSAYAQPYIAMVTVDGSVVPWLASQTDLLADDWLRMIDEPGMTAGEIMGRAADLAGVDRKHVPDFLRKSAEHLSGTDERIGRNFARADEHATTLGAEAQVRGAASEAALLPATARIARARDAALRAIDVLFEIEKAPACEMSFAPRQDVVLARNAFYLANRLLVDALDVLHQRQRTETGSATASAAGSAR